MPSEMNLDHIITDPKTEFKVNTYFSIVDSAIISIEERFHSTGRHLLRDISLFSISRLRQTKKDNLSLPKYAFDTFCEMYCNFINSADLKKEYIQYSNSFFEFEEAVGFDKTYIHEEKDESENSGTNKN